MTKQTQTMARSTGVLCKQHVLYPELASFGPHEWFIKHLDGSGWLLELNGPKVIP